MVQKPLWAPEPGKMAENKPAGVIEAKHRILSEEEVKARDAGYNSASYAKAVAGWTSVLPAYPPVVIRFTEPEIKAYVESFFGVKLTAIKNTTTGVYVDIKLDKYDLDIMKAIEATLDFSRPAGVYCFPIFECATP